MNYKANTNGFGGCNSVPSLSPELTSHWPERFSNKRLVLSVTAGRTGTQLVAALFRTIPGVSAGHEPEPNFVEVMRPGQKDPSLIETFLIEKKLPAILALPEPVYVETSHVACKGFLEPIRKLGLLPDLLLITRDARKIAFSLLERRTVPGRTSLGKTWLLHPEDPNTLAIQDPDSLTDYQMCFWYAKEIERRQKEYAIDFAQAGAIVVETSASALGELKEWIRVLSELNLYSNIAESLLVKRHAAVLGKVWNRNPSSLTLEIDFDSEEAEVFRRISLGTEIDGR
jgi:hypothetical protein